MGTTNFPNGVSSFGIPIYGSSSNGQPLIGNVLFVNTVSGVNAGSGNSPTGAYGTLAYALTQVGAGGTIYLMPGSTITVSDATSQPLNVAGVTIIGMGQGSSRPLFDFTTANTATIPVSAANVNIQNCRFRASFLSIAAAFTVTAVGFALDSCLFFDTSGVLDFLNIINASGAANTADGLTVTNSTWKSLGTTSVNTLVLTANDVDRLLLSGNTVLQATTVDQAALAVVTAGVLTNARVAYNRTYRNNTATTNGALINVGGTTSTGIVNDNYCQTLDGSSAVLFVTTVGLGAFNNYVSGAKGTSGILTPANS